jgi:hypothetical protein
MSKVRLFKNNVAVFPQKVTSDGNGNRNRMDFISDTGGKDSSGGNLQSLVGVLQNFARVPALLR